MKESVSVIQRVIRAWHARKYVANMKYSAVKIQVHIIFLPYFEDVLLLGLLVKVSFHLVLTTGSMICVCIS